MTTYISRFPKEDPKNTHTHEIFIVPSQHLKKKTFWQLFPQRRGGVGRVDLGGLGKKCSDSYGLQETLSRNSYMTSGLYRYSLTELADLPPVQHMRGT